MSQFTKNFNYLYSRSGCVTDDDFGSKIGLSRPTVNKLKNGKLQLGKSHADKISRYAGIDAEDLNLEHTEFVKIYSSRTIISDYKVHALRTVEINLQKCRDIFSRYKGQYTVYTNSSDDGIVVASLLEIVRVTKYGIEFHMINPYCEEPSKYEAYEYTGYLMPIDEFLYFVGEQKEHTYEILTMILESSGSPKVKMLKGLWTGIGVRNGKKIIASVPALAVKRRKSIGDWKLAVDKELGYIKIVTLPEMVRTNISSDIVEVQA